jgi:hypothetical protein
MRSAYIVIASEAKQSRGLRGKLDCFVALLLAMTKLKQWRDAGNEEMAMRDNSLRHCRA